MTTTAEYRAKLFDTASEFKTAVSDDLARIDRLITRTVDLYSAVGKGSDPVFDEIVVYSVAADLRDSQLNAANSRGYNSMTSGSETVTFFSASTAGGNSYRVKLRELLGDDDGTTPGGGSGSRRSFGAHVGMGDAC